MIIESRCHVISNMINHKQKISYHSGIKGIGEEERTNAMNSGHYVLPATPKGTTHTLLRAIIIMANMDQIFDHIQSRYLNRHLIFWFPDFQKNIFHNDDDMTCP
jgi:hypothetical protein